MAYVLDIENIDNHPDVAAMRRTLVRYKDAHKVALSSVDDLRNKVMRAFRDVTRNPVALTAIEGAFASARCNIEAAANPNKARKIAEAERIRTNLSQPSGETGEEGDTADGHQGSR